MEAKIKKHPLYISVAEEIAGDVRRDGYGLVYATDMLVTMLGLKRPKELDSADAHTSFA